MKRTLSLLLLAVCATIVCAKEPQRPTSYNYQRGVEAVNNNDDEEGKKYLEQEIADNPKNGYAYAWLAGVQLRNDEIGSAISMLTNAIKYIPKADKYYHAWTVAVVDGQEVFCDPTHEIGCMDAKKYTIERFY